MPETIIDRKAERQREHQKAQEEKHRYSREVVDPEVKRLKKKLFPIVKEKGEIHLTLSLDGRYFAKDPESPYPEIAERRYKIFIHGISCSDGWDYYVAAKWWSPTGSWDGPYSRGKPGWTWVSGHHEMLLLKAAAEEQLPEPDPKNLREAQLILARVLEEMKADLSHRESAALLALQDHLRDPSHRLERR